MKDNNSISSFTGDYSFLSNMEPVPIEGYGLRFSSAEAAYMAAKCANPEDREKFVGLNGYEAKKLGRRITLRKDWSHVKLSIMENILVAKFSHEPFKSKLLSTGNKTLIEGNYWHDNFWGVCTCPRCIHKDGQNNLGKLLMKVRESLR